MVFVKVGDGVDDLFRFLRGCSVVEVYEGVIVYFSFQYWEVFSNPIGIQDYFSASTFSRFASIFASSSSSIACFSSKVDSLGIQSGVTPFGLVVFSNSSFQGAHSKDAAVKLNCGQATNLFRDFLPRYIFPRVLQA